MAKNRIQNQKGVALVFTLFFVTILWALQAVFILNVVKEARLSRITREQIKTFYSAHGGVQAAVEQLDVLINNYLQTTIASANPSGVISNAQSKVSSADGIGWLVYAVRNNNVPVLSQNGDEATYSTSGALGGTAYTYTITFTEKTDPTTAGTDAWDFPYSYRIDGTGTISSISSKVVLYGDFTVRVQRDNFAKFALFTNNQQTSGGTNVWFTSKTNFSGPLHTNNRYNFAFNPSGTFDGAVTQVQQTANFYNNGFTTLLNANVNGTIDVPTFNSGFTRNVAQITLNTATEEQDMKDQATGNNTYNTNGIYVPNQAGSLTGGIYVKGDGAVALSVNAQDRAVYTVSQGATTKTITVDRTNNQTSVSDSSTGTTTTYSGKPDGVDDAGTLIFVDGNISALSGTVQRDTEVTVASHSDMTINNHLRYSQYTAATGTPGQVGYVPPSATGTTNLMGLVSWAGNVRVGTSAPNDLDVHGSILAQGGVFTVDNYDNTGVGGRGSATLLGGAITNNYGAFGLYNGGTGQLIAGYGRNFVYDQRMSLGSAPPYFPSLNTFIAFTNDITDKTVWLEGE